MTAVMLERRAMQREFEEALDRRLVAGDAGHHDVARAGLGLLAGDDEVTREDARLDH